MAFETDYIISASFVLALLFNPSLKNKGNFDQSASYRAHKHLTNPIYKLVHFLCSLRFQELLNKLRFLL